MKVVTLKIPISQSIYDTAKFAVEEGVARSEEEFLARIALKGIFSDLLKTCNRTWTTIWTRWLTTSIPRNLPGKKGGLYDF